MEQKKERSRSVCRPRQEELDDAALLSRIISLLRFPLIVGIVCIHAGVPESVVSAVGSHAVYDFVHEWSAQVVARVAVPLFFLISGYLFFLNVERLTLAAYGHKLWKRVRTLFVPYVWWNVAAPLQWWLLKRLPRPVLLLTGVWWLLSGGNVAATVFFFMLGAWLGIGKRSFGWALWRLARPAGLLYVMWSVVEADWGREFMPSVFHQLGIVLGTVCVMGLAARYVVHGGRQWKWLQASSFWIYATHVIVLGLTQTWLFRSYRPESDIELLLVFMAQIAWPVGAGAALYALMHKCLPRLTAWLTGGR